jgi:hypothetical protein
MSQLVVGSQCLERGLRLIRRTSRIGTSAGSAEGGRGQQGQYETVGLGARHVKSLSE